MKNKILPVGKLQPDLVGEVEPDKLITPRGAHPSERVLLTKGVHIEGTSILAREFPERLRMLLSAEELHMASNFLFDPGIAILPDSRAALQAGRVTAMHDPTEGGGAAALWVMLVRGLPARGDALFGSGCIYCADSASLYLQEVQHESDLAGWGRLLYCLDVCEIAMANLPRGVMMNFGFEDCQET